MANKKTTEMTFPYPLGKVFPGANYATLSAPLTQNVVPTDGGGSLDTRFNGIFIQASSLNDAASVLYICNTAAAPDTTNYSNILGEVLPGQWFPRTKEWMNNRDIGALFIGAANATDFAIVSIDQF